MRYFQDRMKHTESNGLASGSVLEDDPEIKRRRKISCVIAFVMLDLRV